MRPANINNAASIEVKFNFSSLGWLARKPSGWLHERLAGCPGAQLTSLVGANKQLSLAASQLEQTFGRTSGAPILS